MGKDFIIKGADFSANGIVIQTQELIYDSITGKTVLTGWDSPNATAISVPPAANVSGRTITKIALKKAYNATFDIGIIKYNTSTHTFTLLATIPKETFNANDVTEVSLGYVAFGTNDLLMVGGTINGGGSEGTKFAVATGDSQTNFGRYTLRNDNTLSDINYTSALMCKIWAWSE